MFNVLFIYQMEISLSDYVAYVVGKENVFSASLDSECAPDLVFCDLPLLFFLLLPHLPFLPLLPLILLPLVDPDKVAARGLEITAL